MRWQKAARFAIAVFIVGFSIVVVLALRKTGPPPAKPERLPIDDKAVVQTQGGANAAATSWCDGVSTLHSHRESCWC